MSILDEHQDSSFHWAAYKGNLDIVGLLNHLGLPYTSADSYGQTPLHLAALIAPLKRARAGAPCASASVARVLIAAGAPKDAADVNGRTALFYAQAKANKPLVELLSI